MTSKKNRPTPSRARYLYAQACDMYLRLFCHKHGFDYEKDAWVARKPGTVAYVADYFVSMETIITDISSNAPEKEFIKWYDYTMEATDFNLSCPSFDAWLRGCPRTSPETLKKLRDARENLEKLIKEETEKCTSFKKQ